jgi:hypothetical protein
VLHVLEEYPRIEYNRYAVTIVGFFQATEVLPEKVQIPNN